MSRTPQPPSSSLQEARSRLATRLRSRRPELEQAVLPRVYAVSDVNLVNPDYLDGLRAAVRGGLDYGLAGIEKGEARAPEIPVVILAQARTAARRGVSAETVMRRYVAGNAVLRDFLVAEIERGGPREAAALRDLLRTQGVLFDRLLAVIVEEHRHELRSSIRSPGHRRLSHVKRLLDGELVDTSELGYDMDASHIGLVATGNGTVNLVRGLASALDRRSLIVSPDERTIWAWLGGRHRTDSADVKRILSLSWPDRLCLSIGEPADGVAGWRQTHHQAKAAMAVALLGDLGGPFRYSDDPLLVAVLQGDLHARSLHQLFLAPLESERDGGQTLRNTLRAYIAAERNISSAAMALNLNRRTVTKHLRTIEDRLGHPLQSCLAAVDAALRLQDLGVDPSGRAVPEQPKV